MEKNELNRTDLGFIFQEADLGLDDLTVTSQRDQVVDFSAPYETSSLRIMLRVRFLSSLRLIYPNMVVFPQFAIICLFPQSINLIFPEI